MDHISNYVDTELIDKGLVRLVKSFHMIMGIVLSSPCRSHSREFIKHFSYVLHFHFFFFCISFASSHLYLRLLFHEEIHLHHAKH